MPELNTARQHLYLVALPDGKLLADCGCNTTGYVLHPELCDPDLNTWMDMDAMGEPRGHHSRPLLLRTRGKLC